MAEEKILDEEMLDDEELENVAGGTNTENRDDKERLKAMGYYNAATKSLTTNLQASFSSLSSELGCDLHISANTNKGNVANKYFIADQEVSREDFWKVIDRLNSKK